MSSAPANANEWRAAIARFHRCGDAASVPARHPAVSRGPTSAGRHAAALAHRVATLEAILTHLAEGVSIVAPDATMMLASAGFLRMYGFPACFGHPGTPLADLVRHRLAGGAEAAGTDREAEVAARVAALLSADDASLEEILPDGRIIEVRRRRLPDASILSTYTDVTIPQRAAAALRSQHERLRQAERLSAIGSLLAGVAHELNNPLSIVVAHASLLEEEVQGPPSVRAQKIRAGAERCARIVSTFLDMARRRPVRAEAIDIADVVVQALDLVGYGLRSAGIEVRIDLPADLPAIRADADQIVQVVLNLLGNAQHAMTDWRDPPPGHRHRVVISGAADAARVRLAIADNGPGIPDAVQARVFEPFVTTKPEGRGTGIGLTLCRTIIAAHGGSIAVATTPGGGCTMVVHLPRAGAPSGQSVLAPGEQAAAPAARHALVIDDEPQVAAAIAEILAADGFVVEAADDGRTAIGRLSARDFDVVFCDQHVSDPDGLAILRWLQGARPHLADRLVFITGGRPGLGAEALHATTGRLVLEKPLQPSLVRRTARAALTARVAGAGAAPGSGGLPPPRAPA